jgi:hypothetical protein
MLKKNITVPYRFVCFTDNSEGIDPEIEIFPIPPINVPDGPERGWRKLSVFNKQLANLHGKALCLDIDIVIVNNIDYFFEEEGDFRIIKDWNYCSDSYIGASACYRFNIGQHQDIVDFFETNFEEIRKKFRNEQEYLSWKMKEKGILKYWKQNAVISFKRSCMGVFPLNLFRIPKQPNNDVKILAFHGNPLPDEAINGYFSIKRPQRICRKTPWLEKFWKV